MLGKLAQSAAAVAVAAAAFLGGSATPAAAGVDDFIGTWINADRDASGVTRVVVSRGRFGVQVNVFGQCTPRDCDWGAVNARAYAPDVSADRWRDATALTADYNSGFANRHVILRQSRDGIDVEVFTDFNDRSRRTDYVTRTRMRRAGPFPPGFPPGGGRGGGEGGGYGGGYGGGHGGGRISEDCVSFNTGNLQVVSAGGGWAIVDGSHSVAFFGGNRGAAQAALVVIQRYGFDSQCFIERPNAPMTYWRRGDSVPRGDMPGQDCIAVNPGNVQAQRVGPSWKVVDGSNWLLDFGANQDAAQHAVDVIQYYRLNRQCFVARPNPPMQYWLAQ